MNQEKHNEQNSELCLKIMILLNYNPFVKEMIFDSINVFNKKTWFSGLKSQCGGHLFIFNS